MRTISGFLLDVDGVLHIDGEPIPGAVQAVLELRARGIPFVLLTNTDRVAGAVVERSRASPSSSSPTPRYGRADSWVPCSANSASPSPMTRS
jgi:hypothetical protein